MSLILSIASILQGLFLSTVPFFAKRDENCSNSMFHQATKFSFAIIGVMIVILGLARIYKIINISNMLHVTILGVLLLIGVIMHAIDYQVCGISWLIIEQNVVLFGVLIFGLYIWFTREKTSSNDTVYNSPRSNQNFQRFIRFKNRG